MAVGTACAYQLLTHFWSRPTLLQLACSVSIHAMHWFAITAPLVLLFPVMRFVTTQGIIQYISFNTLQMNNENSRKKGI